MELIRIEKEKLDIEKIAKSGQCFRIKKIEEEPLLKSDEKESGEGPGSFWQIQTGDKVLLAEAAPGETRFFCSEEEFNGFWYDFFDLKRDYSADIASIDPNDLFLTRAAEYGKGIRILRQDPWETLICFIISQRKNIPAISAAAEGLSTRFGKPLGGRRFAFPRPEALAKASERALRGLGLGYRAPYIEKTAKLVNSGEVDLESFTSLKDDELFKKLTNIPGVGPKIANCVMLFGYHRINAFPIDVWIKKVIDEHYGGFFDPTPYEGFKGIIQQYMFFYKRSLSRFERSKRPL